MNLILMTVLFFAPLHVFAHEGHEHKVETHDEKLRDAPSELQAVYYQIDQSYQKQVAAIFKSKCMNCHSSNTDYPFYYSWPLAYQLIQHDVLEANEHIGMDQGFPFAGHGTPREDLKAIREEIDEGDMPPLRYKILHWSSGITKKEKSAILAWVKESLDRLNAAAIGTTEHNDDTSSDDH